jgi:hypothetical protein
MSATLSSKSELRRVIPLDRVARHHYGNSKLIKGKLHNAPADNLFPAFSAKPSAERWLQPVLTRLVWRH